MERLSIDFISAIRNNANDDLLPAVSAPRSRPLEAAEVSNVLDDSEVRGGAQEEFGYADDEAWATHEFIVRLKRSSFSLDMVTAMKSSAPLP